MSKLIVFGVAAVGGLVLWRYLNSAQTGTTSVVPNVGQGPFSIQPSSKYPFIANQAPRVDNSNQPWYGGSRAGLQGGNPQLTGLGSGVNANSVASIVSSGANIWNDLGVSDWFNSGSPADSDTDDSSYDDNYDS